MCSVARGTDETILLVREVLPLDAADLHIHAPDQLSVAPGAMLRAARRAQQRRIADRRHEEILDLEFPVVRGD